MNKEEEYIILGFLCIILLLLILISFVAQNKSTFHKFLFTKRLKKISWKKVGKMFLIIQGFFLLCKMGNERLSWFLIISFPIILVIIVLTYYFFRMEIDDVDRNLQFSDEYKSYKKAIERDNKIKDILR
jgi:uncharacterized protein YacL